MMKNRLLLISRSLQMGGAEKNTVNLANALVEKGHEVHILYFKKRLHIEPDRRIVLHCRDFDKINRMTLVGYIYDLFTRLTLAVIIRKSGFIWRGFYYVLYFRIFMYKLEKKYGKFDKIIARGQGAYEYLWAFKDPRFYQVMVCPLSDKRSLLDKWYTKLIYKNKNVIANSNGVRKSYQDKMSDYGVAQSKAPVIHNPCPIKQIQELANEDVSLPEKPYIIHVGRLTYQKNQKLLLQAYARANIDEILLIIGSGQEEKPLKDLAARLGIEKKVIFLGQKSNPYPWMKHAKLFVLTSLYEGFGLVNVESLACGTPVVAADCPGGIHDILIDEQAELISEPTPDAISEKIKYALSHPIVIKPEWYMRFDSGVIADKFLSL